MLINQVRTKIREKLEALGCRERDDGREWEEGCIYLVVFLFLIILHLISFLNILCTPIIVYLIFTFTQIELNNENV